MPDPNVPENVPEKEIRPRVFVGIDPAELAVPEAHRLLLHCVAPRPIAFVSTLSPDGTPNLAPFSYFMAGGANPPSVVVSPLTDRTGQPKDTLRNINATGEYVINVVTYAMRERMNHASAEFPYGISEWQEAGFTPAPGVKVRPARVLESPMAIECRLFQVVPHGSGPLAGNYVIGEVVYFHIAADLLAGGRGHDPTHIGPMDFSQIDFSQIDVRRVDYIARMGADWYARAHADALFELPRPPRVEKYPIENCPIETRPMESLPIEKSAIETFPIEALSVETLSVEAVPTETVATEKHSGARSQGS